jgi:hypothetical protein
MAGKTVTSFTKERAARSYLEVFQGVIAMTRNWCTPRNLVFIAAIVSLACVAAFVVIGVAYPEPVSSAALGPDWQCSRLALVWTTCTRLKNAKASSAGVAREPGCRRRQWLTSNR